MKLIPQTEFTTLRLLVFWGMLCIALGPLIRNSLGEDLAELIPRTLLFSEATHPVVRLGPDGDQVAFIRKDGNRRSLWVSDVPSLADNACITSLPADPLECWWTHSGDRLIVQCRAGRGAHLCCVDIAENKTKNLTPIPGVIAQFRQLSARLPDQILVTLNHRESSRHDLWCINISTGARELIMLKSGYQRIHVDDQFRPVVGERLRSDKGIDLIDLREGKQAALLKSLDRDAPHAQSIVGLNVSASSLLVVDRTGRDKSALQSLDLESGAMTVLAEHPDADIHPVPVVNRFTNEVIAASCYFGDVRRIVLHDSAASDFAFLNDHFGSGIGVVDISNDQKTWLVVPLDGGPFRFHLYQPDEQQVTYLFSQFGKLDGRALASRSLHVVKSRDGLNLPCHLYLPPRSDRNNDDRPDTPLPLLIWVHGGPSIAYAWDDWLTNRHLQLLANRGYASLRVEFRGADGFGKAFRNKGHLQWGGKAQQDLLDVARWATENKIAVAGNVGLWGWSYGGYATMVAAAFHPSEFKCGMALYGVSSLEALIRQKSDADWRDRWRLRLGDERTVAGRSLLRRHSPLNHVNDVGIPLLVSCGGRDELVPSEIQTVPFVERLQQLGKPVTYLFYPDEPHDYRQNANWISFWSVAERFFADHLGGQCEPFGSDLRKGSMQIKSGRNYITGLGSALSGE